MEVAHDRHIDAHPAEAILDVRNRGGSLVAIDGDAHELGAGAGERRHLPGGSLHVGGIGVGHRLDDDRAAAADAHTSDVHRYGLVAPLWGQRDPTCSILWQAYVTSAWRVDQNTIRYTPIPWESSHNPRLILSSRPVNQGETDEHQNHRRAECQGERLIQQKAAGCDAEQRGQEGESRNARRRESLDEQEPEWKCDSNDQHLVGEPRQRDRAWHHGDVLAANAATARIGTETAS
jgi:hypothetical protein